MGKTKAREKMRETKIGKQLMMTNTRVRIEGIDGWMIYNSKLIERMRIEGGGLKVRMELLKWFETM